MTIGVLALQGDFAEHITLLKSLNVHAIEVRTAKDLASIDGLILPGGESTVMSRFLDLFALREPLLTRIKKGMPVFGTCAGAILLSKKALGPQSPKTLGLLDIDLERNAYGSQGSSFEASLKVKGIQKSLLAAFIRAPIIKRVGKGVTILASHSGKPVLVQKGAIVAATFHPEVRGETALHKLFLRMIRVS